MGEGAGGGGQNRGHSVPPPLHPLPRWGGELFGLDFQENVRDKFLNSIV